MGNNKIPYLNLKNSLRALLLLVSVFFFGYFWQVQKTLGILMILLETTSMSLQQLYSIRLLLFLLGFSFF
jgi:hypothetical protein